LLLSFHLCACSYFSTVLIFIFILNCVQIVLLHLMVLSGHKFFLLLALLNLLLCGWSTSPLSALLHILFLHSCLSVP
jgi:hypothetical protein